MSKKVRLRAVDADNWEDVAELKLSPEQQEFIASNLWSIAESKFNAYARPRAIYAGKKVVGFLMYESLDDDDAPNEYSIYRFMVAKKHQGKGYGRIAMTLALKEIAEDRDLKRITICYVPENERARAFYASFGFREVGLDEDGEMIAEIIPGQS